MMSETDAGDAASLLVLRGCQTKGVLAAVTEHDVDDFEGPVGGMSLKIRQFRNSSLSSAKTTGFRYLPVMG